MQILSFGKSVTASLIFGRWPHVVVMSAIVLALIGCATTYDGERAPEEEPATIEGSYWGSLRYDRAAIRGIDEKDFGLRPVANASILPGDHSVTARCFHGWGPMSGAYGFVRTLEFTAVSGHKYQVKCKRGGPGGPAWAWIEDKTTGEVVAGDRPE